MTIPQVFTVMGTAALVGALGSNAGAGIIRHDREDQLYRDLAAEPQFAAVGDYSAGGWYGSLTLIHPNWALTAAHVVDYDMNGSVSDNALGTVRIGGETRRASQLIVPTGVGANPGWNGDIGQGFDIALVYFEQAITSITPATIYTGFQELGQVITMVGYGRTGTGTTGATKSLGTKRAGNNVVDELFTLRNGATAFRTDFDEPAPRVSRNVMGSNIPLDLEYHIGPGDSGGGSFLFENGQWYLAGVHSGVYDFFNYPGAPGGNSYGDVSLITRVAAYQTFIYSNIPELALVPEPASSALVACLGAIFLRRQRRA